MSDNKNSIIKNIPLVTSIIFFSTVFIYMFSLIVLQKLILSLVFSIIFSITSLLIASFYSFKERNDYYKQKVYSSFVSISKKLEELTEKRSYQEIEFDKFGASFRVFLLNGKDDEIQGILNFVMKNLKNDKEVLFQSVQVASIDNKDEISKVRKVLKERISVERKSRKSDDINQ